MSQPLTARAFYAFRWGYAGFVMRAIASFGSGIVLARLLGPKPFGQVAAAALVFGIANQLSDGGFSSALVQARDLAEEDVRFAFTFQLAIGTFLTVCCLSLAHAVGVAFRDPLVEDVIRVMSAVFLIQAFGQSSAALLKRRLAFRALQTAQVVSSIIGYGVVGIVAASLGAGVWSLVAAQLAQSTIFSGLVFIQMRHSLVPCWSRPTSRLAIFGLKVTGANILNWSISNFDNAFVGRAFGSTALGLYSRAFNTVSVPADSVVSTWQQVLYASCSRAGDRSDPNKALQRAYLASVSAVSLITLPVFWSVSACAPSVIAGLYGARWAEAAPLLRPLALAITVNAIMALAGPMLAAADQVKREVQAQALSLVVAIAAFSFCIRYSAVALAWAVLGVYVFRFVANTQPTLRLLDLDWGDLLRVLRGPIVLACITAVAVWSTARLMIAYSVTPAWTILWLGLTGIITSVSLLLLAADQILARELVQVLVKIPQSRSARLSHWLEVINAKQVAGSTLGDMAQRKLPENDTQHTASTSLFIATLLPENGDTGVHTHFNALRRYLREQNISAEVLSPRQTPKALRGVARAIWLLAKLISVDMATYVRRRLDYYLLAYRMRQSLPTDEPWTVYAQCPLSSLAALSCRTRSDQKVTMIVHFNLSQSDEMADRGRIRREGWAYRKTRCQEDHALLSVDQVIYCSEFMRAHLQLAVKGLDRMPSTVVPNFINPIQPSDNGPAGDIISIGTLEPRKNQSFLLHVLAEAKKQGKLYSLTIVGGGESEVLLKALAADLGIASQVTFTGYLLNAASLLHRHRLYAHSAKMENCPIVLIEALSIGLPVLAPAVGGIPEIFANGVEGYFWDINDPGASARLLISILDNEHLQRSMSIAARRRFERHFGFEENASTLWNLLSNPDQKSASPCEEDMLCTRRTRG